MECAETELDLSVGAVVGYIHRKKLVYGMIRCNRLMVRSVAGDYFCITADEVITAGDAWKPGSWVLTRDKRLGLVQENNTLELNSLSPKRGRYQRRSFITTIHPSSITKNYELPLWNVMFRVPPLNWTQENVNYSIGSTVTLFPFQMAKQPQKLVGTIEKNDVLLVVENEVVTVKASDIIWWENRWQVGGKVMCTNGATGVIYSAPKVYLQLFFTVDQARPFMIEDIESNSK